MFDEFFLHLRNLRNLRMTFSAFSAVGSAGTRTAPHLTWGVLIVALFVVSARVSAAELDLSIVRSSDGASSITVLPGTTVTYEIRGPLSSSTDNEGLAFWSANLEFDSEDASINNHEGIVTPTTSPMNKFTKNDGFTNPAGYVGTSIAGKLVQIGGGQNTIDNESTNAPYPIGDVALGVAHTSYQVLATGTYEVPSSAEAGEAHVLKLTACLASVIDDGDTTSPYATHAVKANCDTAVLTIGTPPNATVTAAVARKSNPSGPGGLCDLSLLPATKSEPRTTGITEVRITFDTAPGNPAGSSSGITIDQKVCPAPGTYASYSGSSAWTGTVSGNVLVLNFNPALENARTYRINLGALITTISGQTVEIRGLVADATSDGSVNAADRSAVVGIWTGPGFSCNTDFNSDGVTNAADRSTVVGYWTNPNANCAP